MIYRSINQDIIDFEKKYGKGVQYTPEQQQQNQEIIQRWKNHDREETDKA